MAAEAARAALDDAGLRPSDVDGIIDFSTGDSASGPDVARGIGAVDLGLAMDLQGGGNLAVTVVGQAFAAVRSGTCDVVVVFRSLNGRSGNRYGRGDRPALAMRADMQFAALNGYVIPPMWIAMFAQRHKHEYGTTDEDFGQIAVTFRRHAAANPHAMQRQPITMDDYRSARWICEPFRLYDCCLETDGAVAVAIVSADRAKDLPHRPVLLQGAAWGGGVNLYNNGTTDLAESPAKPIAKRLYHAAGVDAADIDFAELYDCFTFTLLAQIEGYGFAEDGGVPDMLRDGAFDRATGTLPVNTHGGLLSEGYLHGFNHVYEAVQQIRGEAEHRQVDRHDLGLVAGQLGYISAYSSALVLAGA
jgi:acetyl-CoA acetyltransferase